MAITTYADYGVEKIRKDKDGNISELRVHHREEGNVMKLFGWYTKAEVISRIEQGSGFMTISIGSNGWNKGADIHVVNTTSGKYLRTDGNNIARDNLGNLPEG
jgi:hypothetical protein